MKQRERLRAELVKAGTPADLATVYANAFAEYQEAMESAGKMGVRGTVSIPFPVKGSPGIGC